MLVKLFKKESTYIDKKDNQEKRATRFYNLVSKTEMRPMTFYEGLQALEDIRFSFDEYDKVFDTIVFMWSDDEASDYASAGGGANSGGVLAGSNDFGYANYKADTGIEWLDSVLQFLSDFVSTISLLASLVVILIKDFINTFYSLYTLFKRFLLGVPV